MDIYSIGILINVIISIVVLCVFSYLSGKKNLNFNDSDFYPLIFMVSMILFLLSIIPFSVPSIITGGFILYSLRQLGNKDVER